MTTRKYNANKRQGSKRPTMKDFGQGYHKRLARREYAVRMLYRELYFKNKGNIE